MSTMFFIAFHCILSNICILLLSDIYVYIYKSGIDAMYRLCSVRDAVDLAECEVVDYFVKTPTSLSR